MGKFLVVGDVHLTDPTNAPSVRSSSYTDDILKKLDWLAGQAEERGCEGVVQLGDLFHIKAPSRSSHRLVQQTHEVLTSRGIPVIIVPGNHDMRHDRLDSLDAQPLGALGRMSGITVLTYDHDEFPIFSVPFLQDWNDLPKWIESYKDARCEGDDETWILAMHAPIFPDHVSEPPYDHMRASDVDALVGDHKTLVAYGHIHDPHGIHKGRADSPVQFANFGAISRGSLHAETLKRSPAAYVFDTIEATFDSLQIPHRPIEDVFPMSQVVADKAREVGMTDFLTGVGSGAVDATNADSVVEAAKSAGLDDDVVAAVVELITTNK